MKITGQGIQGAVAQTLHNADAQKHFSTNSVRSLPLGKRKPLPELRSLYRFKGDYFKQFTDFKPWASLGCTASMCPDFRDRQKWFDILAKKYSLINQLVPLAPWASVSRATLAYISCRYQSRTAKFYLRNAYNEMFSEPLMFYTFTQQKGGNPSLTATASRPDGDGGFIVRLPFLRDIITAETFFLGACLGESSISDCKFLFTIGKVLSPNLKIRPFGDVNFNFQF